jgi:hypothetical protein
LVLSITSGAEAADGVDEHDSSGIDGLGCAEGEVAGLGEGLGDGVGIAGDWLATDGDGVATWLVLP